MVESALSQGWQKTQGWHGRLSFDSYRTRLGSLGLAWPADDVRDRHDTLQIRDTSRPLLPGSDVNLCSESCFGHQTSNAKRFKAVAWQAGGRSDCCKVCFRPIHPRSPTRGFWAAYVCMRLATPASPLPRLPGAWPERWLYVPHSAHLCSGLCFLLTFLVFSFAGKVGISPLRDDPAYISVFLG